MAKRCGKCEFPKDNPAVLVAQAACELAPMKGYSGSCLLGIRSSDTDLDDGASPKGKKARPNARVRSERKSS